MLCALPVLQNYAAYRVLHLKHHTHLGQPGDPAIAIKIIPSGPSLNFSCIGDD